MYINIYIYIYIYIERTDSLSLMLRSAGRVTFLSLPAMRRHPAAARFPLIGYRGPVRARGRALREEQLREVDEGGRRNSGRAARCGVHRQRGSQAAAVPGGRLRAASNLSLRPASLQAGRLHPQYVMSVVGWGRGEKTRAQAALDAGRRVAAKWADLTAQRLLVRLSTGRGRVL